MTTEITEEIATEVEELLALHPEASASGHNAYYHYCDAVEHFSPYCACVNKIAAHTEKKLSATFAECATAISGKRCPAVSMRKQELEAGVAMFYISRSKYHYEAQLRESAALKALALDNEKGEKANKRKTGSHANVVETKTDEVTRETFTPQPREVVSEPLSFESAMASVLSSEIAKANLATVEVEKPVVSLAQLEVVVKKSMVEMAREMAARNKLANA